MRVSKNSLVGRLDSGETLISDGATGTYLQGKGLEPGACPEEFNISNPDVVRGMARDYLDAGADMVLTNSFGGNKFMLGKYGYGDRVTEFNRVAAEHASSQVNSNQYVIGSIGPTGEFLEPLGDVPESEDGDALLEFVHGIDTLPEAELTIQIAMAVGAAILAGFVGDISVTANVAPGLMSRMCAAALAGDSLQVRCSLLQEGVPSLRVPAVPIA